MRTAILAAACVALVASHALAQPSEDAPAAWLGITYGRGGAVGVEVSEVHDDTGAAAAGLRPGDEIVELDDIRMFPGSDLWPVIRTKKVGDKVRLKVARGGKVFATSAILTARASEDEVLERRLVDKPAPPMQIQRLSDGALIDPSAQKGKVVVLALFPASCDACAGTASAINKWAAGRARDPVIVLAATAVPPDGLRAYLAHNPILIASGSADVEGFASYVVTGPQPRVTFAVIDGRGMVRVAAAITPGDEHRLDDVCVGADRALRALRRRP
ncbi:MAG: PDZ domain-containing protein [Deltaproteobacteria bacterium]|nr:PDZ domain-containing protein [Deltaproteobacteria bacterium]